MIKTLGLRGRLVVWISLALTLTFSTLIVAVTLMVSQAVKSQADEDMVRAVDKSTEELNNWLESRQRDAINLSGMEVFAAACKHRRRAEAEETLNAIQKRSPFYENVFLADANGKLFADSIGGKSVGIDLMSLDWFKTNVEHGRQKELWMGEVSKSPATGRPVTLVTAPIIDHGQMIGLLGTPIDLTVFSDTFLKGYKIAQSGYLIMFDSAGTILAHPDTQVIFNENITQSSGRAMLDSEKGAAEYTRAGILKTARFQRAHVKPWTVAAVVPKSELLSEVHKVEIFLIGFGILALAACFGAIWGVVGKASGQIARIAAELAESTAQFSDATNQIANSSQSLADSASKQAASAEETSASAQEVSSATHQNQGRTDRLRTVMNQAGSSFQVMNACMDELVRWIKDFRESGQKVSNIIKVIDGIAFQTNILALNAAVEAARAGESGMGFAVVADEVRNLAQRSAEAAKNTAALIQESMDKTGSGQQTVTKCADAMAENLELASQVTRLVEELAASGVEQVRGMDMISKSLSSIEGLVQTTAANAEESASASQEIAAQAGRVSGAASELQLIVKGA